MGNPLGPTFANFYMCELENKVFSNYPDKKPLLYARYVDDICVLVNKFHDLVELKLLFEQNSCLKFTFETEINKKIPFLDVLITRNNNNFSTSVYTKPTNSGDLLNYNSLCPDRYKTGLIKSLLFRSFKICSSWQSFHDEVNRIKQLLTNNEFPMSIIDKEIASFLNKQQVSFLALQSETNSNSNNKNVQFFFHNQMSCNHKQDENQLTKIIRNHVLPCDDNSNIKLTIYYKTKKLSNMFIKNKPIYENPDVAKRHHVVYQFSCSRDGCSASHNSYIGYTTCTVGDRFRMHTRDSSSIKKHLKSVHNINRITSAELISDVHILRSCSNARELIFYEAFNIKLYNPELNSQTEFSDRILKVFKH